MMTPTNTPETGALRRLTLGVTGYAALIDRAGTPQTLGACAAFDSLPKALRRRLSRFDAGLAQCVAGLSGEEGRDEPIVFASNYGNMSVTCDLLQSICGDDLLSPAKFSASVHNAATGFASQITLNRAGHTAVAAGPDSLAAGLGECWLRLDEGDPSVILAFSDLPLEGPYLPFDEGPDGVAVQLAIRLAASSQPAGDRTAVLAPGRAGALALALALADGAEAVSWTW